MGKVLRIIYRAISTHLLHKAGLQLNDGATGAVTLIQRFGSAQHEDDVLVLGSIHLRSELASGLPKLVLKLLLHAIPCRLLTLR